MHQIELAYMSPEMVEGHDVDRRTDLFSVGTLLYELLTGVNPFRGENDLDTLTRTREAQFVPLSVLRPDLPRGLETIINRALTRQRDDRFQNAGSMADALTAVSSSAGIELTPPVLSAWLGASFNHELQSQSVRAELLTNVGPHALAKARRCARLAAQDTAQGLRELESFPRGLSFIIAHDRVPPPRPGSLFGPYFIERQVVTSSKLPTYLASSPVEGSVNASRTFLLKLAELGRDRADVIEILNGSKQVAAELRVAPSLVHESIVQTHELGVIGQYLCAATEPVSGHDIGRLMCVDWFDPESHPYRGSCRSGGLRHRLSQELVLLIGQRVCDALIFAEKSGRRQGIELRIDLSPWQIVVGFDGSVKLADLGLNRVAAMTIRSPSAGSWELYRYLAPERADGRRGDQRSDIYSLGLVLFEALSGRPWIEGEPNGTIRSAVRRGRVSTPEEIDLDVSDSLKTVVAAALHPLAEHRYQSAREMRDALCRASTIDGFNTTTADLAGFMKRAFPDAS